MREIKFRAWNLCDEKMIDAKSFAFEEYAPLAHLIDEWTNKGNSIMQYTGLKDMNGKEIYEGDIVKRHFFTNCDSYYSLPEIIGEIIFEYGAFVIKNKNHITALFMEIQENNGEAIKHYEVIGNVYENPEVLND